MVVSFSCRPGVRVHTRDNPTLFQHIVLEFLDTRHRVLCFKLPSASAPRLQARDGERGQHAGEDAEPPVESPSQQ